MAAIGLNGVRFRSRLRCRRNGIRSRIDRTQCLLINFAGYVQSIAYLITPNRRSRLGILVARNGTVVKTLALESLLQRSNRLIGVHETDSAQGDDKTKQRTFHNRESNIRLAIDSYTHVRVRVRAQGSTVGLRLRDVTFHFFEVNAQRGANETAISIVNVHLRDRVNVELLRDSRSPIDDINLA